MARSRELEALTREVEALFRALPDCPRALSVELDGVGNIRVAFSGRQHVFNPLFADTAMRRPGWAPDVLAQLLGPGGLRIAEVARRAGVVASLTPRQLAFLGYVAHSHTVFLLDPDKVVIALDLAGKGLLEQIDASSDGVTRPFFYITPFGLDALAAHA